MPICSMLLFIRVSICCTGRIIGRTIGPGQISANQGQAKANHAGSDQLQGKHLIILFYLTSF